MKKQNIIDRVALDNSRRVLTTFLLPALKIDQLYFIGFATLAQQDS